MSRPPVTASIGTFGSGPDASFALPVGDGQPMQKCALLKSADQRPKAPSVPGGSAAAPVAYVAARVSMGASVAHGSGPSAQTVAAKSPLLSSIASPLSPVEKRSLSRPSGLRSPSRAAWTAAGSSASIPGLRSPSTAIDRRSSPVTRTVRFDAVRPDDRHLRGRRRERIGLGDDLAREVGGCGRQRPFAQNSFCDFGISRSVSPEYGSVSSVRDDGVEEQPVDVGGVRQRIGDGELRPVRRAPERDLRHAERDANGLEILGVVARGVEDPVRPDLVAARLDAADLFLDQVRGLQGRAVDQPRLTGAAVVDRDERVPGEEVLVVPDLRGVEQPEDVRRALTRPACDQEHHAALDAERGEHLHRRGRSFPGRHPCGRAARSPWRSGPRCSRCRERRACVEVLVVVAATDRGRCARGRQRQLRGAAALRAASARRRSFGGARSGESAQRLESHRRGDDRRCAEGGSRNGGRHDDRERSDTDGPAGAGESAHQRHRVPSTAIAL